MVFGIPEVTKSSCELTLTLTMQVIRLTERAPADNAPSLVAVWCLGLARSKPACHYPPLRQNTLLLQVVATGFPGYEEVENMKRAFEESIESERLRRERDEEELQQIIAQIDRNVHEAQLAKLQRENEERQKERERKKKHQN